MPKSYPIPTCDEQTKLELVRRSQSRTAPHREVERATLILGCLAGRSMKSLALEYGVRPNTVIRWRQRFSSLGIKGLEDGQRSGRKPRYTGEFRNQVLAMLETPPPPGQAQWDGHALAGRLGSSPDAIWRVLRHEGIHLQRRRSWCISMDPEFTAKAADIVGLYLSPPVNALVICVDEKPSIQALERRQGYVKTSNRKIVMGYKSTYKRHGTLNLFSALTVATGKVKTAFTELKRRSEFIEFMTETVADFPAAQELHFIMDNSNIHKKNELWLAAHPNVHFHFTPTSASWLNMVEIWFGMLTRKALRNGNFHNKEELRRAIEDYIAAYSEKAHPFVWRKREVKGSQLRNTIVNLCK